MVFKCFNNLGLFHDTEIHLLLEAPITSRGRWTSKKLFMEFVSHLGKKLLLPGLLDAMLYELDMQDRTHREMTAELA